MQIFFSCLVFLDVSGAELYSCSVLLQWRFSLLCVGCEQGTGGCVDGLYVRSAPRCSAAWQGQRCCGDVGACVDEASEGRAPTLVQTWQTVSYPSEVPAI